MDKYNFNDLPPELQLTSFYWLNTLPNVKIDDGIRIELVLRNYPKILIDIDAFSIELKQQHNRFKEKFAIYSDFQDVCKITLGIDNFRQSCDDENAFSSFTYDCSKDSSNRKCAFCGCKYGDSTTPYHLDMRTSNYIGDHYSINGNSDFNKKFIKGIYWDVFKGNTFLLEDQPIHIIQFSIAILRY